MDVWCHHKKDLNKLFLLILNKLRPLARRINSIEKTIDLVEELINLESLNSLELISKSNKNSSSSESPPTSPKTPHKVNPTNTMDDLNPPPPPPNVTDPMMNPRGLLIVVPHNLSEIVISTNLSKFLGSWHKDSIPHVEKFEDL